jgi:hypothetical protein
MLTARDIYERVSNHLLTQRAVSEDENGSCRLRSGNGRKCAIGSLIADELYRPEIEGIGISYYRHAKDGFSVDQWPQLLARVGERHAFV